nr:MAG TPA: hypothetical protein [Caudoviricetes sp.]
MCLGSHTNEKDPRLIGGLSLADGRFDARRRHRCPQPGGSRASVILTEA